MCVCACVCVRAWVRACVCVLSHVQGRLTKKDTRSTLFCVCSKQLTPLALHVHVCIVCLYINSRRRLRGQSLYRCENYYHASKEIATHFEKWILLSKCFLFASNKLSEIPFSLCELAAGVQCGHALILCGGPLVLFSGCLVQS